MQHRLQPRPATSPTRQLGLFRVCKLKCHLMPRNKNVHKPFFRQAQYPHSPRTRASTPPPELEVPSQISVGIRLKLAEHLASVLCVCFFQLFQDVRAIPSFQCLKTPFVFNMASIIVGIGCRSEMVAGMAMVGSQVGSGRVRPHVLVQCFWINVLWN